jgi:probable HAF family extracellular repeat protein
MQVDIRIRAGRLFGARIFPVVALMLLLAVPASAQRRWVPTDVGTLGGSSVATAVNNAGQVVGYSQLTTSVSTHAFLWTADRGMMDLGALGGNNSRATDINDAGQVVGWSEIGDGRQHAFFWTPDDGMVDLGPGEATDINAAGLVVGSTGGFGRPFLWTKATGMVDPQMDHPYCHVLPCVIVPSGVNDLGHVVGTYTVFYIEGRSPRAFLWTADGALVEAGLVDGGTRYIGRGLDINNFEQAVGNKDTTAFLWTIASEPILLGEFYAQAINDAGHVVGGDSRRERAVFWTAERGMVDLPALDGGLNSSADDINESGWIVGSNIVRDANGSVRDHAILWRPREDLDFDADANTDNSVFRPADGTWYILKSSTTFTAAGAYQWGNGEDIPLPRHP